MRLVNVLKQFLCRHKNKKCITNLNGDMCNINNKRNMTYRSIWKCEQCGKIIYMPYECDTCDIVNWYTIKKVRK